MKGIIWYKIDLHNTIFMVIHLIFIYKFNYMIWLDLMMFWIIEIQGNLSWSIESLIIHQWKTDHNTEKSTSWFFKKLNGATEVEIYYFDTLAIHRSNSKWAKNTNTCLVNDKIILNCCLYFMHYEYQVNSNHGINHISPANCPSVVLTPIK
jgi:hypothetical protein